MVGSAFTELAKMVIEYESPPLHPGVRFRVAGRRTRILALENRATTSFGVGDDSPFAFAKLSQWTRKL